MRFHSLHGSAVVLTEDQTLATRANNFCNGIVFIEEPINIGTKVCIELTKVNESCGSIRMGITSRSLQSLSKGKLPKFIFPDLLRERGCWVHALPEKYSETGNRVMLHLDSQGQLHYFINNEHKGIFLCDLPTSGGLWAVFDIYGNTKAIRLVSPDEAPVEILARGPDAMQAYHKACESGTRPEFRTRLMLLGQDRVGKTSLKKALTGQSHNTTEMETDGIDLSESCSFNMMDRKAWRLANQQPCHRDYTYITNSPRSTGQNGQGNSSTEEYNEALAENIIQELLYHWRLRKSSENEKTIADFEYEVESSNIYHELLTGASEDVTRMVNWKLKEFWHKLMDKPEQENTDKQVTLDIWDFSGNSVYYTTHQVFLTPRAVYIIVFNLCHDLDGLVKSHSSTEGQGESYDGELTNLEMLHFWIHLIYLHTSHNTKDSIDNTGLSPPIFIVGTHRHGLHQEDSMQLKMAEMKFKAITDSLWGKPYQKHIVPTFYAVENSIDQGEDVQVANLRQHIQEVAHHESYMGEQIPVRWLNFESAVSDLVQDGTSFASIDQMSVVAKHEGITSDEELRTMLEFYHDLGVIIYFGRKGQLDNTLCNTVILNPQWLVDRFREVITFHGADQSRGPVSEFWQRLDACGIMDEQVINRICRDIPDQKPSLLGLMEKFDLLCDRLPPRNISQLEAENLVKSYYVPSRLKPCLNNIHLFIPSKQDVMFYLEFSGFLPDGLFQRILTRAIRWSQENDGRDPRLYYRKARLFLDQEHDFIIEMEHMKLARIRVTVIRVAELSDSDDTSVDTAIDRQLPPPDATACARVRNFLDSYLSDLREMWMRRISYKVGVQCHCDRACQRHHQPGCQEQMCLHFLNLDECLTNKIVCCEHRRIRTSPYRKWFPAPVPVVRNGPVLPDTVINDNEDNMISNIEAQKGSQLPGWVKSAAKLLNGGSEGQDWTALAKKLGYKKNKIDKFNDDLNPGLALIADWIISSGNTALSVDMMVSYLEQLHREDIVDIIQKGREAEVDPPQVFISYQWDSQDEVRPLRDRLEKAGFTCWMDIGQMGGGDQLHAKIDEGIRNSKVVIACLSPKYTVSHYCSRELSLADITRKPIIPVMYDKVPWPPPGGMALMFSQLVYIDMKGVGGHGGSGIHADTQEKYAEIIQQVSKYAVPDISRTDQSGSLTESKNSNHSQSSLQSGSQLSTGGSRDHQVINDFFHDRVTPPPRRRASRQSEHSLQRPNQVEQVHVTKCAVCCML
ncbi:uncharacterized protein LOC135486079 [Lineus longissimus]|uniref:uncharacterized protein LOC135486079 n=1 Tax=Lineus longissimus TaxID=88925 RepID=UPI00315DB272